MNGEQLWNLLRGVAEGKISARSAFDSVATEWTEVSPASESTPGDGSTAPPGIVDIDLERQQRCGFPEVVYAPGKSIESICEAFRLQQAAGQNSLATRCCPAQLSGIHSRFPNTILDQTARTARLMCTEDANGHVVVVTAGTSDLPVALEACETLRWMNVGVELVCDIGVAGPQRLLARRDQLNAAQALVVVAGMEGALPSVVGGWVKVPVIGVPTSVGYGANLGGVSALLSMLNSCAANVCVVNIDAGFKGGYLAGMISRQTESASDARNS